MILFGASIFGYFFYADAGDAEPGRLGRQPAGRALDHPDHHSVRLHRARPPSWTRSRSWCSRFRSCLPLIKSLGYDPLWFGVIKIVTAEVGMITPPVGLNCFVVARYSGRPVAEVFHGVFPHFIAPSVRHCDPGGVAADYPVAAGEDGLLNQQEHEGRESHEHRSHHAVCHRIGAPRRRNLSRRDAGEDHASPCRKSSRRARDPRAGRQALHGTGHQGHQRPGGVPALSRRAARQGKGHGATHRRRRRRRVLYRAVPIRRRNIR